MNPLTVPRRAIRMLHKFAGDDSPSCVAPSRGCAPSDEDAGFNSIIARTPSGRDLLRDAEAAGAIRIVRELTMRDMDDTQPHQVCKKGSVSPAGRDAGGGTPAARRRSFADNRKNRSPSGRGGRRPSTIPAFAPADGCTAHCRMSS